MDANRTVILLDLKMPRVCGRGVVRQLKADRGLKHIPVVMMTSSREDQHLIDSYALGVSAYVVKPPGFHEDIETIEMLGAFWVGLIEAAPRDSHRSMRSVPAS